MEYWTYRIKDSRGEEVIDYIGKDLKTEKEARLAAIGDVQTALKRACKDVEALFPVTMIMQFHEEDDMIVPLGAERYSKKEVSEFGKGEDLSLGELLTLAKENYNEGGDAVYECWDQNFYDDYVKECGPVRREDVKSLFSSFLHFCEECRRPL
jgi:hypothetical protein